MAVDNNLSKVSSERLQWQKVFDALVHMVKTQQTQLQSLVKERKFMEDRIQIQYKRWVSDVHLLEDQIAQLKSDLQQADMIRLLQVAKSDLAIGLKQTENLHYKLKLENTQSDLEDFRSWFDHLTRKFPDQGKSGDNQIEFDEGKDQDVGTSNLVEITKEDEKRSKISEVEFKKLKRAYEKLSSNNSSEVSALLSERNFVWNQFKKMESEYTSLLRNKRIEVEVANAKIKTVVTSMEQLQSSNNEKDEMIEKLKAALAKYEEDMDRSKREILRLSKELEVLRTPKSAVNTSFLKRCTMEPSSTSGNESQKSCRNSRKPALKKESHAKNTEKDCKRSIKRKAVGAVPSSESPRLFSSTFKVPKVVNSSASQLPV